MAKQAEALRAETIENLSFAQNFSTNSLKCSYFL